MNNHKTQCMVDIASITINIVNFVIKRTDFANNVWLPNNTSGKLQLLQQALLRRKYFNISRLFQAPWHAYIFPNIYIN